MFSPLFIDVGTVLGLVMFVSVYLRARFCQEGDGTASFEVQARLAMLNGDFKLAEMHYLEQVGLSSSLLQPSWAQVLRFC